MSSEKEEPSGRAELEDRKEPAVVEGSWERVPEREALSGERA